MRARRGSRGGGEVRRKGSGLTLDMTSLSLTLESREVCWLSGRGEEEQDEVTWVGVRVRMRTRIRRR